MAKKRQYNHQLAEVIDALGNTRASQVASQKISDGIVNMLENIFGKQGNSAYDAGKKARQAWEQSGKQEDDPYTILGVAHDADWEVVKASYKALAKKYHPDSGKTPDEDMMTKVNDAYAKIKEERGMK